MEHPLLVSKGGKPRRGKVVECEYCAKEFYLRLSLLSGHNFCSYECYGKWQRQGTALICKSCGEMYYRSPSQIKWRGSSFCSNKCKGEFYRTLKGNKSKAWQGGKSAIYRRLRNSAAFKDWRVAVFERDNYTCQNCGSRSGRNHEVYLHPHHIKSFTHYPEQRFNVGNGKTLCVECHRKEHSSENKAR